MGTGLELDTRSKLLEAAVVQFGKFGFAGTSVRKIADEAGVNHGSIKYHYSSKDELWRAAVAYLYKLLEEAVHQDEAGWENMSPREQIVNSATNYIRFSARHPELSRIIFFETMHESERLDWLVENFIRPYTSRAIARAALAQEQGVYRADVSPMYLQYINITAAKNIFLIAPQIKRAFDIDVFDEDEIERHIEAVLKITLLPDEKETSVSAKPGTRDISEKTTRKKISS
ncbi:TetR/AcrR family transcriptional regulator [Parasphingorhabdus sp.]|uniref:TetR/AcrR family transcriptional regulator n=1 Tax=Parasphingorhabdus sp. TaxID=2709688 RepID=UPI00359319F5